ncbi:MAG: hypothetical protein ACJATN_002126 [Neolewinella sp.]|jgi:hypothetical protein
MNNRIFFYLAILVCLITLGCRDDDDIPTLGNCDEEQRAIDPQCENYDPCLNLQSATADFELRQGTGTHAETFFDTIVYLNFDEQDTLLASTYDFYAVEDADEYLWTFPGTNITSTDRNFELTFSLQNSSYRVPVTLTTTFSDTNNCLAISDRTASSERTFLVGSEFLDTIHYGEFLGKHCDVEEDLQTIRISDGDIIYEMLLTNLPYECSNEDVKLWVFQNGRKFFLVSQERNNNICGQAIGVGELSVDQQTIKFTYRFTRQDGTYEHRCWEGQRL